MIWLYSLSPFIAIGLAAALGLFILGMIVFKQTAARHKKSERYTIAQYYPDEPEVERVFNSYNPVTFKLKSANGYKLVATRLSCREGNPSVVVLIHGLYGNRFEHAAYANEYLRRGFDVLLYNQRATNGSGGHCNTYGYYERRDLDSVVRLLSEKYGYEEIGVHGFSMGAGTAAMHSSLNEKEKRVSYYILDSPYSSMYDELLYIAKRGRLGRPKKRKLPFQFMLKLGNFMNWLFLHFGYRKVQPREEVASCSVPMFVIHGKLDPTCPVEMGEEIFDRKVIGMRRIWTPERSAHIRAYFDGREEYFDRVMAFIEEARKEDGRHRTDDKLCGGADGQGVGQGAARPGTGNLSGD